MADQPQSYASHSRYDPMFHFFLVPASVMVLIAMCVYTYKYPSNLAYALLLWSVLFIVALFKMRLYALRNQDRIIRLEESLRLSMLLPEHLRARIPEFRMSQLIALRFAADAELPELAARTLDEKLSRDDIKKAIKEWRSDHHRI